MSSACLANRRMVALAAVAVALSVLIAIPSAGIAHATPPPPGATPNEIIAVAGGGTDQSFSGLQPAHSLELSDPRGTAVDADGNVYIADTNNNVVREVTPTGVSAVVAGDGVAGNSGNGGSAKAARLDHPEGVAVASNGTLYIADTGNNEIRSVSAGIITDYAGNGTAGYSGDNGSPTSAELDDPYGVAVDGGIILIADTGNNVVREVYTPFHGTSPQTVPDINPFAPRIVTIAGGGVDGFGDGGPATAAELIQPTGVAADADGDVFIADSGDSAIREVTPDQNITTAVDAPHPRSVAVDPAGDIFIADPEESEVLEQPEGGTLVVLDGVGTPGDSGDNGLGSAASLDHPSGVSVDKYGDAFIADSGNDLVRENVAPRAPTFVGSFAPNTARVGTTFVALFLAQGVAPPTYSLGGGAPAWLHVSAHGRVAGTVPGGTTSFVFTVIATNGAGAATLGPYDVTVPKPYVFRAASAAGLFVAPWGITNIAGGDMLVADATHNRIDTVTPSLAVSAHFGVGGTTLGKLDHPGWAVQNGAAGDIYVSDTKNNRIDVFSATHVFLGKIGSQGTTNGKFEQPEGIAIGPNGDLYVADTGNNRIQEFTGGGGFVNTFGVGGTGLHQFEAPTDVAFSPLGLLVTDYGNGRIQVRSLNGTYRAQIGKKGTAIGEFDHPFAMAVDSGGNLFVTDHGASRVEEFSSSGQAVNQFATPGHAHGQLLHPTGIAVSPAGIVTVGDTDNKRVESFREP